jgi:hypothetical protein
MDFGVGFTYLLSQLGKARLISLSGKNGDELCPACIGVRVFEYY